MHVYLDPVTFTPSNLKFVPEFLNLVQESREMRPREIFMHRTVIGWVIYVGRHCRRAKIFYLPQPGIEPGSLDQQANTLPRRCKSRLLPQCSRSVLVYMYTFVRTVVPIKSDSDLQLLSKTLTCIVCQH